MISELRQTHLVFEVVEACFVLSNGTRTGVEALKDLSDASGNVQEYARRLCFCAGFASDIGELFREHGANFWGVVGRQHHGLPQVRSARDRESAH